MQHFNSVDPQDLCVHVWVRWVAVGERKHIRSALHVDLVSSSLKVVGCIVYCHCETLFKVFANYLDRVAIVVCERGEIRVILAMQDAG